MKKKKPRNLPKSRRAVTAPPDTKVERLEIELPIEDEASATALFNEGRAAFKAEDFKRSKELLLEALQAGADASNCRLHLARIYNHCGDWAEALAQWLWLRDYEPKKLEPHLQVARSFFRLKRYAESAAEFEAVLSLDSNHAEAQERLRQIGEMTQKRPSVLDAADIVAPSIEESRLEKLVEEGREAFKAGNYARSEEIFQQALRDKADETVCRLHLARIYNQKGDWSAALNEWLWLRDRDLAEVEPQLQVARALFRLKRPSDAESAFKAVLALQPDHLEAQQRLKHIEALAADVPRNQDSIKEVSAATALLNEGRSAFKEADYARSEELLRKALEAGANEFDCRQHLARIYNLEQEWSKAMEQWRWLRDRFPGKVEPHLQVGRGHYRLNEYGDAAAAFEAVLKLVPDHPEARKTLDKIAVLQLQDGLPQDASEAGNWLSLVPTSLRWPLSGNVLQLGVDGIVAQLDLTNRQLSALAKLVNSYGESEGELAGHRQLYALQTTTKIDELTGLLKNAKRGVQGLAKRTEKMLETFEKFTGRKSRFVEMARQPLPRGVWRETLVKLALEVHQGHGLEAALSLLFREALVEDRQALFAELSTALRETDRDSAIRLLWLSYGANPSPAMAERTASKMFQTGDLANSAALIKGAPARTFALCCADAFERSDVSPPCKDT